MGFRIEWVKKARKKKISEEEKLLKHRIQYTKIVMNTILALVVILSIGSLYINLKTGNNMDTITVEAWQSLWKCVSVYCVKSFAEKFAESKADLKLKELFKDKENQETSEY